MHDPIDLINWQSLPNTQPPNPNFGRQVIDRSLDIANPLHHIPFVGHLYRAISGDEITPEASITGGFLYGGPLGALGGAASILFDNMISSNSSFASNGGGDAPRHPRIDITDPWRFNE